jgi:hypothetical protein|tara:strand:- start:3728 stop:3970 length:243 start_codon:yes stop_codon:yes gene_type:complete
MENNQLHFNDEMLKVIDLISDIVFVTFNETDFEFVIDSIKENLDIEYSNSDVWSESDEEQELTFEEIDYLNNINNHFIQS